MYVFEASFASRNPRSQLPHADHESGQSAGSGSVRHGNHSRCGACFTNFAWPGCLVFSGIYIYIFLKARPMSVDRNGHHFKSNSEVKGGRICVSWLTSKAKLHLLFEWMARSQFFRTFFEVLHAAESNPGHSTPAAVNVVCIPQRSSAHSYLRFG